MDSVDGCSDLFMKVAISDSEIQTDWCELMGFLVVKGVIE